MNTKKQLSICLRSHFDLKRGDSRGNNGQLRHRTRLEQSWAAVFFLLIVSSSVETRATQFYLSTRRYIVKRKTVSGIQDLEIVRNDNNDPLLLAFARLSHFSRNARTAPMFKEPLQIDPLQLAKFFLAKSYRFKPNTSNQQLQYYQRRQRRLRRHQKTQTFLVPFPEVWDADYKTDRLSHRKRTSEPFDCLVKKLGCPSLNKEGILIPPSASSSADSDSYTLYLATHVDDLPPIAQLTIDVFDATAITLSSTTNWNALEQAFMGAVVKPAVGMYNAYAHAVAYTEVLSGLRKRMKNRISNNDGLVNASDDDRDVVIDVQNDWLAPLIKPETSSESTSNKNKTYLEEVAAQSSLILALAHTASKCGENKEVKQEVEQEVVATIELRLQPTDAKIPFSQPWLDSLERKLARVLPFATVAETTPSTSNKALTPLRPYLCNLCVSPTFRSQGIGRALVRIVEAIAYQKWGFSHLYLHVDPSNGAARKLYEKEGYVDVGRRWNMIWTGSAEEIGYYVKVLGKEGR